MNIGPLSGGNAAPEIGADFRYDVAFSFLQRDEGTAREIEQALEGRLRTFIYSDHQEDLAGKDGHDQFSIVFGKQARIVVVLYRLDWGKKGWTRVEETAIKNRGHDDGYDFLLLAPMEPGISVPVWLPKPRIWLDFMRYGVRGAAAVIETRVREVGGSVQVESAAEYAARLRARALRGASKGAYLESPEGSNAAKLEGKRLLDAIDSIIEQVRETGLSLARDRTPENWLVAYGKGYTLEAGYHVPNPHTSSDARARVALHEGRIGPNRYANLRKPRELWEERFAFTIGASPGDPLWQREGDARTITATELADYAVKRLLQQIEVRPDE